MTWPDVGILDAVLLFHLQPFELRLLKTFDQNNSSSKTLARENMKEKANYTTINSMCLSITSCGDRPQAQPIHFFWMYLSSQNGTNVRQHVVSKTLCYTTTEKGPKPR